MCLPKPILMKKPHCLPPSPAGDSIASHEQILFLAETWLVPATKSQEKSARWWKSNAKKIYVNHK